MAMPARRVILILTPDSPKACLLDGIRIPIHPLSCAAGNGYVLQHPDSSTKDNCKPIKCDESIGTRTREGELSASGWYVSKNVRATDRRANAFSAQHLILENAGKLPESRVLLVMIKG